MTDRLPGYLAIGYLTLCIFLGGASGAGAGAIANGLLQAIAVVLILIVLWGRRAPTPAEARVPLIAIGLFAALTVIYAIPLPAGLWQQLPGRDGIARSLEMIGAGDAALPIAMAPQAAIASALSILPPAALFLLVLYSPARERQWLAWAVIALATLSLFLGAAQLAGGMRSPLRFYSITTPYSPVGFFANTNNLAMLLLAALPVTGYLAARGVKRNSALKRRSALTVAILLAGFITLGVGMVGSLAGYGLLVPAMGASFLIYWRSVHGRLAWYWLAGAAALVIAVIGVGVAGPFKDQALSAGDSEEPTSRGMIAMTTLEPIRDHFPVGTGLAAFADVYRIYEGYDRANPEYVNHVHNDYLEIVLELGLAGAVLILLVLGWLAVRTLNVWRNEFDGANLARAATVIIGILLVHSLVEFPLRTSALAGLAAMAAGLLAAPAAWGRRSAPPPPRRRSRSSEPLRHLEAD